MIHRSHLLTGAAIFAVIGTMAPQIGCSSSKSDPAPAPVADPSITSFVSAAPSVVAGSSTTLTAVFKDGTAGIKDAAGTVISAAVTSGTAVTVTPAADTTYTLTVTNTAGVAKTATVTVTVTAPPPVIDYKTDISPNVTLIVAPNASSWVANPPVGIADAAREPARHDDGSNSTSYGNWPMDLNKDAADVDTVEYDFDGGASVARSAVYWYSDDAADIAITTVDGVLTDNSTGGLGAPSAYKIQYWDAATSAWVDVKNPHSEKLSGDVWVADTDLATYYVSYDAYDVVGFDAVTSTKFQLVMNRRIGWTADNGLSLGINRWKLYGGLVTAAKK